MAQFNTIERSGPEGEHQGAAKFAIRRVGVIGLGNMGHALAVNLVEDGYQVRVFDRNQGEKLRTQLDIDRNQRLLDATKAQVFDDVDSAYASLDSTLSLLRPYKEKYLQQAVRVRDTVSFSYQHGGASLLEFLQAETDYRTVELNYVNLIGSYLTAASQLNLAVGHEVIQ